jgi:succinate dehydrogenase / fumarate reductase cytochrome b subunit
MIYRWQLGFWAFLLMRISGLALALYLFMHLYVLTNLLEGPATFNQLMKMTQSPLIKFLELVLLGGVVYHAVNGIRILGVDFFSAAKHHKTWFWVMIISGVGIFLFGAIPVLKTF